MDGLRGAALRAAIHSGVLEHGVETAISALKPQDANRGHNAELISSLSVIKLLGIVSEEFGYCTSRAAGRSRHRLVHQFSFAASCPLHSD